jgi:alcohol dehydrogenase
MRVPTENAVPIVEIDEKDASRWCALGALLVPFGGFLAAQLQAGEIALVNGATGSFGSAAVAVALGMGAQCVVATGRNEQALAELTRRFGARVRTVPMRGHEADDRDRILQAAPGPIDCVLDILPPAANAAQVRTAIMAVRPYGRVVLMGGVGMHGGAGLDLPYSWMMRNCITLRGQWMYPPHAAVLMTGLISAGLVDLDHFEITAFDLDRANEAVAHAAAHSGPFKMTVIRPR